jgi:transcriptional regulator of acetoin/glycerol metabolism
VAQAAAHPIQTADLPRLLDAKTRRTAAAEAGRQLNVPSAPVHIDSARARPKPMEGPDAAPDRFLTPAGEVTPLADLERAAIVFALRRYGGRMSGIARALGIGRSTLYRKLREHGLEGGADPGTAGEPGERRLAAGR